MFRPALLSVGLMLCACAASAQELHRHHPPEDQAIHERFYSTWMRPDLPQASCCSNQDCEPAEARWVGDHWEAKGRDGAWVSVPPSAVEHNRDSPDGRSHLCHVGAHVYCFIAGSGS